MIRSDVRVIRASLEWLGARQNSTIIQPSLPSLERSELRGEVAKQLRRLDDAEALELLGPIVDLLENPNNIVEVRLGVRATRDGQAKELELGVNHLPSDGIRMGEHHGADFTTAKETISL